MHTQKQKALKTVLASSLFISLLSAPLGLLSQSSGPLLVLKPHCILPKESCPTFSVENLDTLRTDRLSTGDILDVDVVLQASTPSDVRTIRAWLSYNPAELEARSVELLPALTAPIPGESIIDAEKGLVKIGGGIVATLSAGETSIARVTFRVRNALKDSRISYYGFASNGTGETSVQNASGQGILSVQPASLLVDLSDTVASSIPPPLTAPSPSPPVQSTGTPLPSPMAGGQNSAFSLLQPQFVKLTTQGRDILVGWESLRSSQLAGYNVYYGTVSGLYLQRRSIPATTNSLILRDLEAGTQYFVAVRGYDANSTETAFSQEEAVVVGRPETSTSPLSEDPSAGNYGENPIESNSGKIITGETGISEMMLVLCVVSALIGTGFAVWRQHSIPFSR